MNCFIILHQCPLPSNFPILKLSDIEKVFLFDDQLTNAMLLKILYFSYVDIPITIDYFSTRVCVALIPFDL